MNKKRIAILFFTGVTLVVGVYFFGKASKNKSPSFTKIAPAQSDIEVVVNATGTVQSQNRVEIKPPTSGRVDEIKIEEGQTVRKGQIIAWMSSSERASLLDAARAVGSEEVARWKELYRATPILSPLNGTLIASNAKPGQTVTSADIVFVVSDRLIVQATVDETDIAQVKPQQVVRIALDAYSKQPFSGHVSRVAYDAKTVNNVTTYQVELVPTTVPDFVKSGMTANVSFLISRREQVLTIPSEAIKTSEGKSFVLVADESEPKMKPVRREITAGLSDGKKTEVVSGIDENDSILVPRFEIAAESAGGSNPFMPAMGKKNARRTGGAR